MTTTVLDCLIQALSKAAAGNSHAAVPAAAVLWPDKERHWESALKRMTAAMPQLLTLGEYEPEQRAGPAIWLKCAVARTQGDVPADTVPVVYLSGVSRAELRAIESCPRDLQPLAELQYRGVFWSQVNGKDWTLSAFLSSGNGGLGLDVAQDKATQEALGQILKAGLLLDCPIDDLKGRTINAEWLLSLLAPNPTRDLLAWMNDPAASKAQWGDVRWDVFIKRCRSDFGFDPVADGALAAAEKLASRVGKWAAVAELYKDSFASFPKVFELLAKVQPPQVGLFPDLEQLAGFPQINEQSEASLRYKLSACAAMDASQARTAIVAEENGHGLRRGWLWRQMGKSPLALSLEYLVQVAEMSKAAPIGTKPSELAASYEKSGWKVDQAAVRALSCVETKADIEAVSTALRAVYLPWLEESAKRLQDAAKLVGGLPPLSEAVGSSPTEQGTCTVFVDGLRYDVAATLADLLASFGEVQTSSSWTSMPSVTASGKAWCSPVAQWVSGTADDIEFEPRVAADGKQLSAHNFRKLLGDKGIQVLGKHETGEPVGLAWTEVGDLDHYGHEHGIRLARDLQTLLAQVVERVSELCQAGWTRIRIVTDHGWLLVPGGLPKSELPKHQTETRWGRCAVLKDMAHGTELTFGWDWCKDVQVAYAPGVSSFIAGAEYAHGGLSLQECLVPVLSLKPKVSMAALVQATIKNVTWKRSRCFVEIESDAVGLTVDIRTKPALASSTLLPNVRPVDDGKAKLVVANDDDIGSAVVIVVLGPNGEVIQKQATTVGG